MSLEARLRTARDDGRKLLVPYVTGGFAKDWPEVVQAIAAAGADAIEIGIPFSDPVMDGPTIQAASEQALAAGTTPSGILRDATGLDLGVPLVVMTYYNLVHHAGSERFAASLVDAGVSAAIVPDLPLEELDGWGDAAAGAGIETVLLAAPTTPDDRLRVIAERARGFVYAVSLLGVTGQRDALASPALSMGRRLKAVTDRPVLLGVGISNAAQAREASVAADGVVVGSALMARLLEGAGPEGAYAFVAELRAALDAR